MTTTCKFCDAQLASTDNFCGECGAKAEVVTETIVEAQAQDRSDPLSSQAPRATFFCNIGIYFLAVAVSQLFANYIINYVLEINYDYYWAYLVAITFIGFGALYFAVDRLFRLDGNDGRVARIWIARLACLSVAFVALYIFLLFPNPIVEFIEERINYETRTILYEWDLLTALLAAIPYAAYRRFYHTGSP